MPGGTATAHASTPEGPGPLWSRLLFLRGFDHSDRRVDCDAAARVSSASYHLAVVASDVLLDSDLSEKSSSTGRGRLFPTSFGRTSNHHSSVSDSPGSTSFANQSPLRLCTFPQSPAPHSSCQSPSLPSSMTIYHSLLRSFGAAASLLIPSCLLLAKIKLTKPRNGRRHCSCAGKGPPSPTQCSRHAHRPVREPPRSHVRETGSIAFVSEHVIQTPTRASITL